MVNISPSSNCFAICEASMELPVKTGAFFLDDQLKFQGKDFLGGTGCPIVLLNGLIQTKVWVNLYNALFYSDLKH